MAIALYFLYKKINALHFIVKGESTNLHTVYIVSNISHQFRETFVLSTSFPDFRPSFPFPALRFLLPFPKLSFLPFLFSALGQALDRLVTVSCTRYRASTSVLSTSCSLRGLRLATGDLILRGASRLDAFSVYPVRTWLLCHALGNTTDTPAVRPPRSSRTKGSSSQISCARAG